MSKCSPQVVTCKAVVCWGMGGPVKVEEIQVEPPKSFEVRVKMLYASVCHTDVIGTKGYPFPLFPRVLGHEGVGVVESIGEEVKDMKEGDLVMPTFIGECYECENCISGKTNLCIKYPVPFSGLMPDDTSRMSIKGKKLYHFFSCSTWSEYMVVNANYVLKLDPSTILPHASFLSCGFSTGFGAAWKEAKIEKGSSVAVLGLGAVGLGAILGAKMQGAAKIIGIDKNERKREKGNAFGMTDFINPDDFDNSISEVVQEFTGGRGVDHCIECTGVASLVNEVIEATKLGTGITIGIGSGNETSMKINCLPLLLGRTLKGSVLGGLKAKSDLPIIAEKCKNKEIQLGELLTHEVPLEDINKVFELLKQPDCVKIAIKI